MADGSRFLTGYHEFLESLTGLTPEVMAQQRRNAAEVGRGRDGAEAAPRTLSPGLLDGIRDRKEIENIIASWDDGSGHAVIEPPHKFHDAGLREAWQKLEDPYADNMHVTKEDILRMQEESFAAARAGMESDDPRVRMDAMEVVKSYVRHGSVDEDPARVGQALEAVKGGMADPDPQVRAAAVKSLYSLQFMKEDVPGRPEDARKRQEIDDKAFDAAKSALRDADPSVRAEAIRAMEGFAFIGGSGEYMGKDPHHEKVLKILDAVRHDDKDPDVRKAATLAIAGIAMDEQRRIETKSAYDRDHPGETKVQREARLDSGPKM